MGERERGGGTIVLRLSVRTSVGSGAVPTAFKSAVRRAYQMRRDAQSRKDSR
jgi:hypothetical protein